MTSKNNAPRWRLTADCLQPIGMKLIQLSRQFNSTQKDDHPALPNLLWGAYHDHKLELGLVMIEVAVSVALADRIRKRTSKILRRWEKLHSDACQCMSIPPYENAIPAACRQEIDVWQAEDPKGYKHEDPPKDSFFGRAAEMESALMKLGEYVLQVSAAISSMRIQGIPAKTAERVTKRRPSRNEKLVQFALQHSDTLTNAQIAARWNKENPGEQHDADTVRKAVKRHQESNQLK